MCFANKFIETLGTGSTKAPLTVDTWPGVRWYGQAKAWEGEAWLLGWPTPLTDHALPNWVIRAGLRHFTLSSSSYSYFSCSLPLTLHFSTVFFMPLMWFCTQLKNKLIKFSCPTAGECGECETRTSTLPDNRFHYSCFPRFSSVVLKSPVLYFIMKTASSMEKCTRKGTGKPRVYF